MQITTFPQVESWQAGLGRVTLNGAVHADVTDAEQAAELLRSDLAVVRPSASDDRDGHPVRLTADPTLADGCYALRIDQDQVSIGATGNSGWVHGSQTLLQLLRGCPRRCSLPVGLVQDGPKMPVRGQMIDVGRKFLPVEVLRREIRRMAWYRMNSLHLHLTEWNGWRIGSERYPGLASPEHYTLDELRELDTYARSWGITIVPEIDLPGHAVWLTNYEPRLRFSDSPLDIDPHPGGAAGGWTIDVTSSFARDFVKSMLTELTEVFSGQFIHIGGDEVPTNKAGECPKLAAYARQHGLDGPADVMVDFTNDLAAHLRSLGRRAELWEWWDFHEPKPTRVPDNDIRISKWLNDDPPTRWADAGYDVVGVNWNRNFCTPGYGTSPLTDGPEGFAGFMPAENNYQGDNYPYGPSSTGGAVGGYRMGRWMDKAEARPYEWVDFYAHRGLQVIAERTWSVVGADSAVDAFERADAVGDAPGDGPELITLPRHLLAGVTANSYEDEFEDGRPEHLIDRDRRTTWVSRYHHDLALPPHTLEITLAGLERVGGIVVWPRQDGATVERFHHTPGRPRGIRVELMIDGAWITVWQGELGQDLIAHRIAFPPQSTDRVRIHVETDWDNLMLVALAGIDIRVAATA